MPAIPSTVSDGDQATPPQYNAVIAWIQELAQIAAKGDLLIAASDNEYERLAIPVGTGTVVLKADLTTKTISWSADESIGQSATKIGQMLYAAAVGTFSALQPASVAGEHFLRQTVNSSGVVTSTQWITKGALLRLLIPQQNNAPSSPATGDLWIDL